MSKNAFEYIGFSTGRYTNFKYKPLEAIYHKMLSHRLQKTIMLLVIGFANSNGFSTKRS